MPIRLSGSAPDSDTHSPDAGRRRISRKRPTASGKRELLARETGDKSAAANFSARLEPAVDAQEIPPWRKPAGLLRQKAPEDDAVTASSVRAAYSTAASRDVVAVPSAPCGGSGPSGRRSRCRRPARARAASCRRAAYADPTARAERAGRRSCRRPRAQAPRVRRALPRAAGAGGARLPRARQRTRRRARSRRSSTA